MPAEKTEASDDGKKLLDATRPFAEESRIESWWYLGSTLVILGAALVLAAVLPWWPLRLAASMTGGLVLVRALIIYHDYMHGSLLRGSRLARVVFSRYCVWRRTHPMSGGIKRVRLDGVDDYLSLRREAFGFNLAPLPQSLQLPAAEIPLATRGQPTLRSVSTIDSYE